MAQWENPWGYLPYGWGSGLLDYGTRWGGDGSQLSSTGTDRTGYEAARTGEGGNGATPSESSPFGGDTESGSYAMARDAASTLGKDMGAQALQGGLLGGIATDSLSGAAMGALGSALGPGAIQGIANMGARATGFAPQTFAGKTLANVAPGMLGFLGGPMAGMFGLLGGSVLGGLAEDAMNTRDDEKRMDAYEDEFGNIAGKQVYGNFKEALGGIEPSLPGMMKDISSLQPNALSAALDAMASADTKARQQYANMVASKGARDKYGMQVSGGPFAGSDGFSIDNALSAGYNTGGYGQRNGGFSGGNAGNGQGYGGGNSGGNNSGGSQGGKNSQGEGYGGR